jgi:hypothetical protein
MTPQAFALALRDLQPQWPDDGSLVLQLNAGHPGERTWFLSDMVCSALAVTGYGADLSYLVVWDAS